MVVRGWYPFNMFGIILWELFSTQPVEEFFEKGLNHKVLFLEFIVHFLFTH
jgi:hypothetical protein